MSKDECMGIPQQDAVQLESKNNIEESELDKTISDDIDRLALKISLASKDDKFEEVVQKSLIFILRLGYPRLPLAQQARLLPILFASLTDDKPMHQKDALQRLTRFDVHDALIPDGFNWFDLGRVVYDRVSTITTAEELEKYKLEIVLFYSRQFLPPEESIIPILFAYGDSRHSVVSLASKELRSLVVMVDWEDETLLSRILTWYLGRRREFDPKGRNEPRRPLSANMRIKLGNFLLRSRITLPTMLAPSLVEAALLALEPTYTTASLPTVSGVPVQLLNAGVDASTSMSPPSCHAHVHNHELLQPATCQSCEAAAAITPNGQATLPPPPPTPLNLNGNMEGSGVCPGSGSLSQQPQQQQQRCLSVAASLMQQRRLAEHGMDLLGHLITNGTNLSGPAFVAALRCLINFVYDKNTELLHVRARGFELLSLFFARDPSCLMKDPAQLPRLFDVLSEENPSELKVSAAHCLRSLANTFQEAERQNIPGFRSHLGKLEKLLYENIEKSDPLCRLVAVHFADVVYPSDHIPTRYLILQALGDKDPRVRGEACMAFEQFLDPNVIHDIVYGRVKLPSFVEFVNHDTQHSRKNPFVEVERLIPVVQFIRLCLLATRGGISPAQGANLTYETEDEVRYLINQNVRYFLSVGHTNNTSSPGGGGLLGNGATNGVGSSSSSAASANSNSTATGMMTAEQVKRSIDTYFRLIQVVIFSRSQHSKESPDFPNYLEEVLVGNTKDLITCNKELFDRMNNVLLATSRGANCRQACASVYSVVVMETEAPSRALATARNMLEALPKPGETMVDNESRHAVQGMFMGAAYLLERLFTRHVVAAGRQTADTSNNPPVSTTAGGGSVKKNKKDKQASSGQGSAKQPGNKQFSAEIIAAIEQLLVLMDPFFIKPSCLPTGPLPATGKDKQSSQKPVYANASVGQTTIASLLESLLVLLRAGCLAHLPVGSLNPSASTPPALVSSKAALVQRIAAYLPSNSWSPSELGPCQRLVQCALRTLAACCMGEPTVVKVAGGKTSPPAEHPHLIPILKMLTELTEIKDYNLHLTVGTSITECLLGPASPLKYHWYERVYPLTVAPEVVEAALTSPAGKWLGEQLKTHLTCKAGQGRSPATLAATLWTLSLVRRIGALPKSFLPLRLIIDLLEDKSEAVQSIAVATLGLIYDRSSNEEDRAELVSTLSSAIMENSGKKQGSPVYRELCSLAQQIGRPDLALSLIVLAIAPPPVSRPAFDHRVSVANGTGSTVFTPLSQLCTSVTYAGLVRRLGRALAPALPRLIPRIFIRRFDYARPKIRQAVENVWLGLVVYSSNSATPSKSAAYNMFQTTASPITPLATAPPPSANQQTSSQAAAAQQQQQQQPSDEQSTSNSAHALASEMVEAHFNAIVCEIKAQLGFNSAALPAVSSPSSSSDWSPNSTSGQQSSATGRTAGGGGSSPSATWLRDACCLAIASLTVHPLADKRLAGHLPALLSGLLSLLSNESNAKASGRTDPAEEAAIAVQKLVIRVLENPCSREAAADLLPGLLPVIIDRAPWSHLRRSDESSEQTPHTASSECRQLSLELLLTAARSTRPSVLRPSLPQLILAGLHTMSSSTPSAVSSLMRQPSPQAVQQHLLAGSPNNSISPISQLVANAMNPTSGSSSLLTEAAVRGAICKEALKLCVRIVDDACLSRLIVPFTELIRAGGGCAAGNVGGGGGSSATGGTSVGASEASAAAVTTATCIFLTHLAAYNISYVPFHPPPPSIVGGSVLQQQQLQAESAETTCQHCAAIQTEQMEKLTPMKGQQALPTTLNQHRNSDQADGLASSPSAVANQRSRPVAAVAHKQHALGNAASPGSHGLTDSHVSTAGHGGGFPSLAPHSGKLLAALLSALPGACRHPDGAGKVVQSEMARTLASLLRFSKETSVVKLFNRVRSWYLHPDSQTVSGSTPETASVATSVSISHWACARVLQAVAHYCPDLLFLHAGATLPLILVNQQFEPQLSIAMQAIDRAYAHQSPCISTQKCICHTISETVSPYSEKKKPKTPAVSTTEAGGKQSSITEMEALALLWQDTWNNLPTAANSLSSYSLHLLTNWPKILAPLQPPSCLIPGSSGEDVIASFLHPPLLPHYIQLLCDALMESLSWAVRTQAAGSILQMAIRLACLQCCSRSPGIVDSSGGRSTGPSHQCPLVRFGRSCRANGSKPRLTSDGDGATDATSGEKRRKQRQVGGEAVTSDEGGGKNLSNEDLDDEENGEEEEEDTDNVVATAWHSLMQVLVESLKTCKPWPGKVWLLRGARLLLMCSCQTTASPEITNYDSLANQLWQLLLSETRCSPRDPLLGGSYRAEAFLTLAVLAELLDRNVLTPSADTGDLPEPDSCRTILTEMFQLVAPNWGTGGSSSELELNKELTEFEVELVVRAIGIIWPLRLSNDHLIHFPLVMSFLNAVMTQSGKNIQATGLVCILELLTKLSADQSSHLVNSLDKGLKPVVGLNLKDYLIRLKRAAENPKSQVIREHVVENIAALLQHPAFVKICPEQLGQILKVLAKDGVPRLRELSTILSKALELSSPI